MGSILADDNAGLRSLVLIVSSVENQKHHRRIRHFPGLPNCMIYPFLSPPRGRSVGRRVNRGSYECRSHPVIFVWFFGFPRKINYSTRTRSFYDGTAFFSSPHFPTPPRKRNDFSRKFRCAGVVVNEFYAWTGLGSLSLDGRHP